MENNLSLSPTQLTAIEETLSSMTRGFEKRTLVDSLLLTLFPEQDPKFLRSWGSLRYTHLKVTAFPERQLWILKNMVEGVISGAAQDWYKGYLEEYPGA
jgi:hypothetical protein